MPYCNCRPSNRPRHATTETHRNMNETIRLRRSVLYMPGSNTRALEKSRTLPADVLIFDLEDAVAPDAKSQARNNAVKAVTNGGYAHREIAIRVNGLDTPWGADDLAAVAACGVDAVLLPKIDSAEDVSKAAQILEQAGAPANLRLWVMIETPLAVLEAHAIATSHRQLDAMVMGTADLAKAMRIDPGLDRAGLIAPLGHCILAARACGLDILDGIYADFRDTGGLEQVCRQGKALGFDGKTLIHPGQIDTANSVFGISAKDLDQAYRIIEAWEAAAAKGEGIAVLNGQMIEQLHADAARRYVTLANIARKYSATRPD